MNHSAFIIAAPSSDSGKSTISIGLLRALKTRGLNVQPFKCGPDYIDPQLHQVACERPSINLDAFMQGDMGVQELFNKYDSHSDISIVEGVMGLLDGYDRSRGSSGEIAKLLSLPVVLVMTPKSMAYSIAPMLYGIKHFCPELNITGVIFNKVNSRKHLSYLEQACNDVEIDILGVIPKDDMLRLPSRHLGLITDDMEAIESHACRAAILVEEHIDIDRLLAKTQHNASVSTDIVVSQKRNKILVARDEAFSFIYPENISCLSNFGEITYFSPLHDKVLPPFDLLYLPGGYPELYLSQLSSNVDLMAQIRSDVDSGKGCIIAECGGMMYLQQCIVDSDGKEYPMVNIFPHKATMQGAKLTIGYRQMVFHGIPLRGHEFHYSRIEGNPIMGFRNQYDALGAPVDTLTMEHNNVLATYTHFTFTPQFISFFLDK